MVTTNIDLGQIILGSIMAIVGWFIRKEISTISARLDRHDNMFFELIGDLHEVRGIIGNRRSDRYEQS